tara:strand:+ start:1521 stop:6545 length:5025 start_codon:yes stop_codon:yes gene_type:complete
MPTKYKAYSWGLYPNGNINYQHKDHSELTKDQFLVLVKINNEKYFDINNFDINKHDQNLFEVAYNKYDGNKSQNIFAKFWLDIDKININFNDLQDLLTDLFDTIDKVLDKTLDRKKYLIYYKHIPNSSKIHSLRIINYTYAVDFENMSNIATTLQEQDTDNVLCKEIDTKVYRNNRQICLPYNSKIMTDKYEKHKDIFGDLKNNTSSTHLFVDYNYNNTDHTKIQTKEYHKYLISYTARTKETLTFTTPKLELEKKEFTQEPVKKDYSNREQLILDTSKIIELSILHLSKEAFSRAKSKWWIDFIKKLKSLDNKISQKDMRKLLEHSCSFSTDYTFEKNIEFYNRLTFNSTDKNYLIRNYGEKTYTYICNYLNNNQDKIYFYTNNLFGKMGSISLWISRVCNIDYDIPYKALDEIKNFTPKYIKDHLNNTIQITDDIQYNIQTGYLKNTLTNELLNYYADAEYFTRFKNDNKINLNKYDLVSNRLTDEDNKLIKSVSDIIDKFINGGNFKVLVAEMKWATGKSFHICKKILRYFFDNKYNKKLNEIMKNLNENNGSYEMFFTDDMDFEVVQTIDKIKRCLIVSPNNSLNRKETQEIMELDGNCFVTHLEIQKLQKMINADRDNFDLSYKNRFLKRNVNMICSVESLDYFGIYDYNNKQYTLNEDSVDTIILDEFNTILNNFDIDSGTFKGKKKKYMNDKDNQEYIPKMENNLQHLINICKIAKRVLIMDADINFDKLDWFLNKIQATDDVYKVKVDYNKFVEEGYTINICENQTTLISQKLKHQDQNKIQELVCVSNNKAKDLFISLIIESFDSNLDLIDSCKNECYGLISGDGLIIFDCRDFSKSILSRKLFITKEIVDTTDGEISSIHTAKYEISQQQQEQKLHQITTKHSIKFMDADKDEDRINELKQDFFDNYDSRIRIDYEFTKYIRTPTIKCGISLNPVYFDELYFFIYFGVLTIEEILQMMWRSRNLTDKNIYITFQNRNFCEWREYYDLNFIQERLNNKTKYGDENSIYITDIDNPIYNKADDAPLKQLILLNELDKINSDKRSVQLLMNKLFYHGFRLNEHIFFISQTSDSGDDYLKEAKTDRLEVIKTNFVNINIKDLTDKQINYIQKRKNTQPITDTNGKTQTKISDVFRNKFTKYKKLMIYLEFHSIYKLFFVKSLRNIDGCEYLESLEDDIDDDIIELDNDTYRKKQELQRYNNIECKLDYIQHELETHFDECINIVEFIDEYKLHNPTSSIITKSLQLKSLLKNDKPIETKTQDLNSQMKFKTDKIITTILKFLDINLMTDFNNNCVKRFIVKNDKTKFRIIGFITEVLSNTNMIEVEDESICFLLWLEKVVIQTDYNHQEGVIKVNKKLDPIKDLPIIKKVINYYLNKIFLYFDYENQQTNSSKAISNLQFVIRKEINIKITNEALVNQYTDQNKKIITQELCENGKVSITETYERNINEIVVKNKPNNPRIPTVIYKDNITEECVINDNIILRPSNKIKRNQQQYKYYYKNDLIPYTEKVKSHPRIIRMVSDTLVKKPQSRIYKDYTPNAETINLVLNFIERQVKIKDTKFNETEFREFLITQYQRVYDNDFTDLHSIKELNITRVKRNYYLQFYKKIMDVDIILYQAYRKHRLMAEILHKSIETPIIILDKKEYNKDYIYKCDRIFQSPSVVEVECY